MNITPETLARVHFDQHKTAVRIRLDGALDALRTMEGKELAAIDGGPDSTPRLENIRYVLDLVIDARDGLTDVL